MAVAATRRLLGSGAEKDCGECRGRRRGSGRNSRGGGGCELEPPNESLAESVERDPFFWFYSVCMVLVGSVLCTNTGEEEEEEEEHVLGLHGSVVVVVGVVRTGS